MLLQYNLSSKYIFYIHTDFLSSCSAKYWERCSEPSIMIWICVSLLRALSIFLFCTFWTYVIRLQKIKIVICSGKWKHLLYTVPFLFLAIFLMVFFEKYKSFKCLWSPLYQSSLFLSLVLWVLYQLLYFFSHMGGFSLWKLFRLL